MKRVLLFLAVSFGLSILASFVIGSTGRHESPYIGLAILAMSFPALALLVVRVVSREPLEPLGWNRFSIVYLPLALLLIPITSHLTMIPVTYFSLGDLPWKDLGDTTTAQMTRRIALSAFIGIILNSLLALFEEVGWRAWLLPQLGLKAGMRTAVVLTAAIWALWHTPFTFSGLQNIDGVQNWQLALIMPAIHFGAGLIIGWLWTRTESLWIVAIAHGALNNWGQFAFKYMADFEGLDVMLLLAQGAGLLAVGVFLVGFQFPGQPFHSEGRA